MQRQRLVHNRQRVGILTFAAAVAGLFVFYIRGLRDAQEDMKAAAIKMDVLATDVRVLQGRLERDAEKVEDRDAHNRLNFLFRQADMAFQEARKFLGGQIYTSATAAPSRGFATGPGSSCRKRKLTRSWISWTSRSVT